MSNKTKWHNWVIDPSKLHNRVIDLIELHNRVIDRSVSIMYIVHKYDDSCEDTLLIFNKYVSNAIMYNWE